MSTYDITRRDFLLAGSSLALSAGLGGCSLTEPDTSRPGNRRLTARPGQPTVQPTLGESALGLGTGRDGLLFVPQSYTSSSPLPLLVVLHGATVDAESMRNFGEAADTLNAVVLIPDSRERTWDMIFGGAFGPDVDFLDAALAHTFDRCAIDPTKICLSGFSDGATYSLSLGVSNGDLFTHLIAFSPGGIDREDEVGRPRVFVSHGIVDAILPVQVSRVEIVPDLRRDGYSVEYFEFPGGHTIPNNVGDAAMTWFLG